MRCFHRQRPPTSVSLADARLGPQERTPRGAEDPGQDVIRGPVAIDFASDRRNKLTKDGILRERRRKWDRERTHRGEEFEIYDSCFNSQKRPSFAGDHSRGVPVS